MKIFILIFYAPAFGIQDFVGPGQIKTIRFVANSRGGPPSFCSTAHPEKIIINVI